MSQAKREAEEWNRWHPVGSAVHVTRDDGSVLDTVTRTEAWVMGEHALVQVAGISGGYALRRVRARDAGASDEAPRGACTGITITGADDNTDPADLIRLSLDYPFVEWGILRSVTRDGQPRYPSHRWRRLFARLVSEQSPWPPKHIRIALHLCGVLSRAAMGGDTNEWCDAGMRLATLRVQLNGFSHYRLPCLRVAEIMEDINFILQVNTEDALRHAEELARVYDRNVSALWDPSGGRGIHHGVVPFHPEGLRLGYAGRINPENVEETIVKFDNSQRSFWLDMESGVRTDDDRFDLTKVRAVLERAAPYIAKS